MSNRNNRTNFIVQGSILAFTSILVRIIGIIYRIPLQNILKDEGMGYYSSAFEIYSVLLLLSSYSLPTAVSKLVAARTALGRVRSAYRIFLGALVLALVTGVTASVILFLGARSFATAMGYPPSYIAIQALAPTLFVMAVVGVLRGYFQGLGTMIPTAFSQVLEQIDNAVISIVAALYLFQAGLAVNKAKKTGEFAYAYAAAGGTIGTGIGAATALIFLILVFMMYRKVLKKQIHHDHSGYEETYRDIMKLLLVTVFPVILSTTVYNISGLLDGGIMGNLLKFQGYSESERSELWGIFSGRYRILTTVPISIAAALASSIIPSLTTSVAEGNKGQIINKINTAVRFTMIIAIPCAVGLAVLGYPIISLLFQQENARLAASLLSIGAASIIFYSLSTITNSVLQGIDKMKLPVKHAAISLLIHTIILVILLVLFHLNVYAVVIADMLFPLFVCILNSHSLAKYIGYKQEIVKTFLLPLLSAVIMGAITFGTYKVGILVLKNNAICTILSVMLSVLVYGVLLLILKVVDEEELYRFPKGRTIVSIAKKLHLLV